MEYQNYLELVKKVDVSAEEKIACIRLESEKEKCSLAEKFADSMSKLNEKLIEIENEKLKKNEEATALTADLPWPEKPDAAFFGLVKEKQLVEYGKSIGADVNIKYNKSQNIENIVKKLSE